MARKWVVVAFSILAIVFLFGQIFEFNASTVKKTTTRQESDLMIKTKSTQSTTRQEENTSSQTKAQENGEENDQYNSDSTWQLFDLPYPLPVTQTKGNTTTTRIPIPDDKLIATFHAKYKEYHENMFYGRKRYDLMKFILTFRFIIYQAKNWGLGNRLEGLITAILAGLLTDHAILIDDPIIESFVNWPWISSYTKAQEIADLPGEKYYAANKDCFFLES